jgi:hypothetical protein
MPGSMMRGIIVHLSGIDAEAMDITGLIGGYLRRDRPHSRANRTEMRSVIEA